jgi:arginine/lysine/ornithine decarboxylase
LHVPGHKYGQLLQGGKYSAFHELLKLDATELPGLDDLHSPEGAIREAATLLSEVYGSEQSYFLVNGSTVGNLAMILAVLQKDDIVLVQRNCHKSVLNGIELAQAKPVFLGPDYDEEWGVTGGVSQAITAKAIKRYPEAKALILTYPNYYGMVTELQEIIKHAHEVNIPVLVDEAHGAHFISGGPFPKSAVTLGADIVVQSAHKTLPAMTMGSYLHLNSKRIAKDRLEHYLHILQSSSPSYPIMASLDIARSYIGTYAADDHTYLHEQLTRFAAKLSENNRIKVLPYGPQKGDPLKVTLQSQTELNGFEMQEAFAREGIFAELADPYNVLLVLPLLKREMAYPFAEVITGINRALQSVKRKQNVIEKSDYLPLISLLEVGREEAKNLTRRKVSLDEAEGEIAAERVTPYPPGIPLLFPGERITGHVMAQILHLTETGARFQEGGDICQGEIYIYQQR